jgi:hypothetical protein
LAAASIRRQKQRLSRTMTYLSIVMWWILVRTSLRGILHHNIVRVRSDRIGTWNYRIFAYFPAVTDRSQTWSYSDAQCGNVADGSLMKITSRIYASDHCAHDSQSIWKPWKATGWRDVLVVLLDVFAYGIAWKHYKLNKIMPRHSLWRLIKFDTVIV